MPCDVMGQEWTLASGKREKGPLPKLTMPCPQPCPWYWSGQASPAQGSIVSPSPQLP